MKFLRVLAGVFASVSILCFGTDLPTLKKLDLKNGRSFNKVRITQVLPDGISVIHAEGATRIKCQDLPDTLAKELGFKKEKIEEARANHLAIAEASDRAWQEAKIAAADQAEQEARTEATATATAVEARTQALENDRKKQEEAAQVAANSAKTAVRPSPIQPPSDNTVKMREIDAKILATRELMIQLLNQAANTRGGFESLPEMNAVMELTKQRVATLQSNLNILLAMKNDLKGKVNGVANVPNNEQGSGYFSNIEKENDRVLILENKAVVEIENTYVGYIGWHKKCLLYKDGHGFKIWIEGKKTYKCELLRAPQEARTVGLVTVTINEVLRDGKFLKLSDGRILKVDDFDTFGTQLLLCPKDALLLAGGELVILEEREIIRVEILAE